MAGERGKLTDLQIRHWVKAGAPLAKADGGGLTFTLSAGVSAGWILRYSFGGRRRELTIGRYPDIGLAEARGIATLKRAEVQQGRNPAAEKQKAKATAARDWTVRDLAKDYRAKKLGSLAHSTQVSYGRHLKRVEKKLGALTVREIEASDVVALIEGAGLTWGESNMLLITTKCLFIHACGKRLINANPCYGIMLSALLGERPPRRQRLMLTREELKLLLAAPMRRRNALAIRILLATAVRSAELYQALNRGITMPDLQTFHGHLVDLRRHVNVHWRHLHPFAPTDRYEVWLRAPDGTERKFTVHTREMPARRGHEVSLITTAHRRPRVLALANWTTIDGVSYARSEPPGLVRVGDVLWLAAGFAGMTAWLGDAGMVLFVPAAAVVLAVVPTVRWAARRRLAWRVDRAIDLEAWRTAKGPVPLH